MKLTFYGAAKTVTGSMHLLETDKYRILIDCGMFQGDEELEKRNHLNFDFDPRTIDFVLLTHAHIDHSGLLPKLVRAGYRGQIIATYPTIDLVNIMLEDAAKVQMENLRRETGHPRRMFHKMVLARSERFVNSNQLIYTIKDVERTLTKLRGVVFERELRLGDGLVVKYHEAGHILGAAIIEINVEGKTIVFSGDLGHKDQFLMKEPTVLTDADYVVVESTYGGRLHPSKEETVEKFYNVIDRTIEKGGNVIIPSFAVERTQELLCSMHRHSVDGDFSYPVYLDSPMALSATEVFSKYVSYYNSTTQDFISGVEDIFTFDNLFLISDVRDSLNLKRRKRNVIIAGSGMCTGGRVLYHLQNNIEDPRSTVLFVGFQAEGTLGRELVDGKDRVMIQDKMYKVKANIETLSGFSAHADRSDLLRWLSPFANGKKPKRVFIVHGEYEEQTALANTLREQLKYDVHIPSWKERVEIN